MCKNGDSCPLHPVIFYIEAMFYTNLIFADLLNLIFMLVQDLKCFVFSLISLHFKIKPI